MEYREFNNKDGSIDSYIIHLLEVHTRVTIQQLCQIFGLAPSTIRKKLAEMEANSLLIRTHGGAVSVDANRDERLDQKANVNIPQKRAIAAAAVGLISDGDSIALGGGSTIAEMCVYLLKLKNSLVLTDSIIVAGTITSNSSIEVRINSGIVRERTGCVVGPGSDIIYHSSSVDKAFIGCEAFSLKDGACSANILIGEVERNLIMCAKDRYVLCDSSKLNKSSVSSIVSFSDITALITDEDADPYYLEKLRTNGLEVIVAPVFRSRHSITRNFL